MPRTHRIEFPGALAHCMSRGLDGMPVFRDDHDRRFFLSRLGEGLARTGYKCLAWALMDNHYHLLLRTSDFPMSKLFRPLDGSYSRWFNKKYQRRGYLWQDRFKSVLCQDQEYARQLVRYIHLNPLRSGKVRDLKRLRRWQWCGHGFVLGVQGATGAGFQSRDEVLRRFGKTRNAAVAAYLAFLAEGIDPDALGEAGCLSHEDQAELAASGKGLPAIVGNPDFVQAAVERSRERLALVRRFRDQPELLEQLADEVCGRHDIPRSTLTRQGRLDARSAARKEFCIRAYSELHASTSQIARFLNLTLPPVSIMIGNWERQRSSNPKQAEIKQ